MAAKFTLFENQENGKLVGAWDHQLPTPTGIGRLEKWVPVYHGEATGLLDIVRQQKEFEEGREKA